MCRLRNIALESVKCDRRTDKVIPMCRYTSQAPQKSSLKVKVTDPGVI